MKDVKSASKSIFFLEQMKHVKGGHVSSKTIHRQEKSFSRDHRHIAETRILPTPFSSFAISMLYHDNRSGRSCFAGVPLFFCAYAVTGMNMTIRDIANECDANFF
jgi:hypothetical protein